MLDQIEYIPTGVIYKRLFPFQARGGGGSWLKIDEWGRGAAATDRMHSVVTSAAP